MLKLTQDFTGDCFIQEFWKCVINQTEIWGRRWQIILLVIDSMILFSRSTHRRVRAAYPGRKRKKIICYDS